MITVVNMIPITLSGEANQDSEPNLAVNPANPSQIVGSAFTFDPTPLGLTSAPIFVSNDGGSTWILASVLPSQAGFVTPTADVTVRFADSGDLYASILRRPGNLRLNILRATAGSFIFGIPPPMTVLVDRDNDVDQPYVQAITDPGSTNDRVYVGSSHRGVGAPVKATIDFSLDGAAGAPVFTRTEIEARTTQDAPPIRPALHSDGTVYGAFYRLTAFNASTGLGTVDVVVVRDDQGGAGNLKFADLTDSSDGLPGRLVVQGRPLRFLAAPNANFGQERLSGSNLSIAVDPNDSDKVYVAWADGSSSADYTLHVQVSNDGGDTWSDTDIRAVTPATNPALAVNDSGTLGFLFQELSGDPPDQRWETHFEFTDDDFNTTSDAFLADVPADTPTRQFEPYLGDYVHLMALGDDFFGIFSANNTPDQNNFPSGVTYQRNTDFDNQTLADVFGNPVAVSIDPFFFKVTPE